MIKRDCETLTREMNWCVNRVIPMTGRTGNPVVNQYVLSVVGGYAFQSYNSKIAMYDIDTDELILGRDWDYSVTTLKYLWKFLNEYAPRFVKIVNAHGKRTGAQNIRAAIDAGEIILLEGWC